MNGSEQRRTLQHVGDSIHIDGLHPLRLTVGPFTLLVRTQTDPLTGRQFRNLALVAIDEYATIHRKEGESNGPQQL